MSVRTCEIGIFIALVCMLSACNIEAPVDKPETQIPQVIQVSSSPSIVLRETVIPVSVTVPQPVNTRLPSRTPSPIPTVTPPELTWVSRTLCQANALNGRNPLPGRLVRFNTPVEVNARGIPAVLEALEVIKNLTDGKVTFKLVDKDPEVGITFILGDAIRAEGTPGCGNVTSSPDPKSGHQFSVTANGAFNSLVFIHLGGINSPYCKYSADRKPYPIAEHELAHALGAVGHFANFTGDEGFSAEVASVIKLLYSQPLGSPSKSICK